MRMPTAEEVRSKRFGAIRIPEIELTMRDLTQRANQSESKLIKAQRNAFPRLIVRDKGWRTREGSQAWFTGSDLSESNLIQVDQGALAPGGRLWVVRLENAGGRA
jgi:hypothetical protein